MLFHGLGTHWLIETDIQNQAAKQRGSNTILAMVKTLIIPFKLAKVIGVQIGQQCQIIITNMYISFTHLSHTFTGEEFSHCWRCGKHCQAQNGSLFTKNNNTKMVMAFQLNWQDRQRKLSTENLPNQIGRKSITILKCR